MRPRLAACWGLELPSTQPVLPQIDDSELPVHYAFWNLAGCANQQMMAAPVHSAAARCCNTCASVFAMIVLGPPSLAIALVLSILCFPCCLPSLRRGFLRHVGEMTQVR